VDTRGHPPKRGVHPDRLGRAPTFHPWRSVNFLTDKTQRDPISDQTTLKALLCRISRAAE
jgi:hypothetical protein